MKRFLITALALTALLVGANTATAAAEIEVYGDFGVCAEQHVLMLQLPDDYAIAPAAAGVKAEFGSWLVGGDLIRRDIFAPLMAPDDYFNILTYDVYFGPKVIDTGTFKLYGLLGYAVNDAAVGDSSNWLSFQTSGFTAGLAAEATAGSVVLDGKLLTTVAGNASISGSYGGPTALDGGSLTTAEARCTWQVNDLFGVYAGYRYVGMDCTDSGTTISMGHGEWVCLGMSITF